jgi:hypothetical protein
VISKEQKKTEKNRKEREARKQYDKKLIKMRNKESV